MDQDVLKDIFTYYKASDSALTQIILKGDDTTESAARLAVVQSILQYNGVESDSITIENSSNKRQGIEVVVQKPEKVVFQTSDVLSYADTLTAR